MELPFHHQVGNSHGLPSQQLSASPFTPHTAAPASMPLSPNVRAEAMALSLELKQVHDVADEDDQRNLWMPFADSPDWILQFRGFSEKTEELPHQMLPLWQIFNSKQVADSTEILNQDIESDMVTDRTNACKEADQFMGSIFSESANGLQLDVTAEGTGYFNILHIGHTIDQLERCTLRKDTRQAIQLHLMMVNSGLESHNILSGHLIRMFSSLNMVSEAQQAFMKLCEPNIFSCTAIISTYIKMGQKEKALNLYNEMRKSNLILDGHVFVAILKLCSSLEDIRIIHYHVIENGLESDLYVGSTMIDMYSNYGSIIDAYYVFNRLPERNIVAWSTLIKGCSQLHLGEQAVNIFQQMKQDGIDPDEVSYVCILKACCSSSLRQAWELHAGIIERGFESDAWIRNALVDLYGRQGNMHAAMIMFNRTGEQDVVAFSSLISGYIQQNSCTEAIQVYQCMKNGVMEPDMVVFISILKGCTGIEGLEFGRKIHADVIEYGLEADIDVGSTLIDMYGKCGSLDEAQAMFLKMPVRNTVTWNSLMTGYSLLDYHEGVLLLFNKLLEEGLNPDLVTFGCAIKSCALKSLEFGWLTHDYIVKTGLELDSFLGNGLVDMYSKNGDLLDAHAVFDSLPVQDVVSWSSLIGGYVKENRNTEALALFKDMQLYGAMLDPVVFACTLKACSNLVELDQGRNIHAQILSSGWQIDAFLGSIIVDMYCSCGNLDDAWRIFNNMDENQSVVTWNVMMAGYTKHDNAEEALRLFKRMEDKCVDPNIVTFICILKACSGIAALEQGRRIHQCIIERGLEIDVIAGSTLINMYSKCGNVEDAHALFLRLPTKNVVTWSALIAGYAQHGNYDFASKCFEDMQKEGLTPDDVAFLCLLSACSHNVDLVQAGCLHFKAMRDKHGILPKLEHHNSLLDVLGHAGWLNEAEDLLETIPWKSNTVGWTSLLSSCKIHGNLEHGKRCFDQIVSMDFANAAAYVLMSDIYFKAGMLDDAIRVQELRKHVNGWKKPAKAYIEIDQEVHSFVVDDKVHPKIPEVYRKLSTLNTRMQQEGYMPSTKMVMENMSNEDKTMDLCSHSEKLAIAFGLISTTNGTTIRVAKNLKMCTDCHVATKLISKLEMREIIVTDAYCVHRFQDGECSCKCVY